MYTTKEERHLNMNELKYIRCCFLSNEDKHISDSINSNVRACLFVCECVFCWQESFLWYFVDILLLSFLLDWQTTTINNNLRKYAHYYLQFVIQFTYHRLVNTLVKHYLFIYAGFSWIYVLFIVFHLWLHLLRFFP